MGSPDMCEVEFTLPPIHAHPSVSPQLGTARYYTMRTVYRGRDEQRQRDMTLQKPYSDIVREDDRQIIDLGSATFNLAPEETVSEKKTRQPESNQHHLDYIRKRQDYFRWKGMEFNQLHSIHRNKEEKLWEENVKKNQAKSKKHRHKLDFDRFRLPPIAESPKNRRAKDEFPCWNKGKSSVLEAKLSWEHQISERIKERLLTANRPRDTSNKLDRKQGKLVSSKRLRQILDGPRGLSYSSFFTDSLPPLNGKHISKYDKSR